MNREANLPIWAKGIGPGVVEIDAGQFYPQLLAELDVSNPDQYWLEVAYQCAKRDVQLAVTGTNLMPPAGGALRIMVRDDTKADNGGVSEWAQKRYQAGNGVAVAQREWQAHYSRIRGALV